MQAIYDVDGAIRNFNAAGKNKKVAGSSKKKQNDIDVEDPDMLRVSGIDISCEEESDGNNTEIDKQSNMSDTMRSRALKGFSKN